MTPFMSRNGLAAMQLARQFLALPIGEQLPRVRDMAVSLGCGNGTVQAGLALLEDVGAISTTARGRLGTFLDRADRAMLWDLGGMGSLTLAMPLPYSRRYEGLASGLRRAFDVVGIPFSLAYMRGSSERANALLEGRVDIAVMSGLAYDLCAEESPVSALADLGPRSYVADHGLVLAPGKSRDDVGLRVAVDRTSADQVRLVDDVFGERSDVVFVDTFYNQLDAGFTSGTIDATVWNLDEIDQHLSATVTVEPLAELTSKASARNTHAVLVVREGSTRVPAAFFADVDLELVRTVLDDVLAARCLPSY